MSLIKLAVGMPWVQVVRMVHVLVCLLESSETVSEEVKERDTYCSKVDSNVRVEAR